MISIFETLTKRRYGGEKYPGFEIPKNLSTRSIKRIMGHLSNTLDARQTSSQSVEQEPKPQISSPGVPGHPGMTDPPPQEPMGETILDFWKWAR